MIYAGNRLKKLNKPQSDMELSVNEERLMANG
jgi:hypothetical protein